MCSWTIILANISTLVLGGRHAAVGTQDGRYAIETFLKFTGRRLELITGVCAEEGETLRRAWNEAVRQDLPL
jgi:hypothetical protein